MARARALTRALGTGALFTALTGWALWPLPRDAARAILDVRAFYGAGSWFFAADAWLCMWILAWDTHALTTDPTGLFQANIFHPAPWTLALSEHLLGYWPVFGPVFASTGNVVLAYNVTLLATFVLSGVAMCALVRHWTGSLAAGITAGIVYAFAPWRLSQLGHMQLLGLWGAPIVLLAWDRVLIHGRRRDTALLTVTFLLQCLASYYLAYVTVVLAGVYVVVTTPGASPIRVGRGIGALGVAAMGLALVSLPYVWARASGLLPEHGLMSQAAAGVPSWRQYVSRVPIGPAIVPYQGRVALGLAAVGVLGLAGVGAALRRRVLALVAVAVVGGLLAVGPGGGVYELLWDHVPGFSSTRVPARFLILVAFAVAALAGIGVARITASARPLVRGLVACLSGLAVLADAGAVGLDVPLVPAPEGRTRPPVHEWLASHGGGRPVLELPARRFPGDVVGAMREQRYAVHGTRHWLPQLTGRSGHEPASYELLMSQARRLPAPDALQTLVSLSHLGWVVVHGGGDVARWEAAGLALAATFGETRVYRVERLPVPDWQPSLIARLRGRPEVRTFTGTPLVPLGREALRAEVAATALPARGRAGQPVPLRLAVRNRGGRPWPGLALGIERLVVLRLRWEDRHGRVVRPPITAVRPVGDALPGRLARFVTQLPTPPAPGRYRLVAELAQGDVRAPLGGPVLREIVLEAE